MLYLFLIILHLFFFFFHVITIFLNPPPPPPPLLPDENAQKNNRGIYTLAESKKTIIINYFEKKKKKCKGAPFSPGRLARLPCGCDKTNRALWVLGLMEFRTSGSSFFFLPPPPFLYLAEDVLGFNEVPPVLNEDSMRRRMGVGVCVAVWLLGGRGAFHSHSGLPLPFSLQCLWIHSESSSSTRASASALTSNLRPPHQLSLRWLYFHPWMHDTPPTQLPT